MSVGYFGLIVVYILGFVVPLPIWGRAANALDWRALFDSVSRDHNPDALGFHIYNAERAVRLRQREIRKQPHNSPEHLELGRAEGMLSDRKAEKVRWSQSAPL